MNGSLIALDAQADELSPWQAVASQLTTEHQLMVQNDSVENVGGSIVTHVRGK
jgi:hypothetical protein